ncbi:hypothetical protein IC620_05205 [Hazenella sp. IB182357]|uniref:Uncharacterized protein n=1 Tax=Polycladospora coralii TaxID=2771432 RepID=A0A926NA18_9BACL|nr:cytochrome D1 domain-containing protein [Polycladospora coralii]MBD1371755.1 hypothetical protein [Polycladospora coralii]
MGYVYVLSATNRQVSVIDTKTHALIAVNQVTNAGDGNGIVVTPNGQFVYIVSFLLSTPFSNVAVFDTKTHSRIANIRIPVGNGINVNNKNLIAVTSDGRYVYIVVRSRNTLVAVICTKTHDLIGTLLFGGDAQEIKISPNSQFAYIATSSPNQVITIDIKTNKVINILSKSNIAANRLALTPDGQSLYISLFTNEVLVIDSKTYALISKLNVTEPFLFAFTSDSRYAYITSRNGEVTVVDVKSNTIMGKFNLGSGSLRLAVSPQNKWVYILESMHGRVTAIETKSNRVVATISVPSPIDLKITPDSQYVYTISNDAGSGAVYTIDTKTNRIVAKTLINSNPRVIAITP